jgi:membrane-associated phospholipid phosphatase
MGKAADTKAPSIGRPWRRATGWLVALTVFFYLTYGVSNWLASQRGDVPAIVFDWEHGIPFLTWTIIPYLGTHVFFALSFYVCRNRVELDSHARRLLTAQLVAVACFIIFPLRLTFSRPQTMGEFGLLFDLLHVFDMPFNQAPSLHIATTTILFDLYSRVLPRWTLPVTAMAALLVGASVLTTYQHHFIDVPTGFLLGLLCVWMWSLEGGTRLASSFRVPWRFSK